MFCWIYNHENELSYNAFRTYKWYLTCLNIKLHGVTSDNLLSKPVLSIGKASVNI